MDDNIRIKEVNELQFLHKLNLSNVTKSILNICDKNNITESDILILSGFLYFITKKPIQEQIKTVRSIIQFNKRKFKGLSSSQIEYELKKIISQNFYKKIILEHRKDTYEKLFNDYYIYNNVSYIYENIPDDIFIKEYIDCIHDNNYESVVRLYFLSLLLGKKYLVDKFTRIQRDKCQSNFIFALNREIIFIGTLLAKYGKEIDVEILSEQTIELSDDAIKETNKQLIEERINHVKIIQEYDEQIRNFEEEIFKLHEENTKMKLELSKIKNQKILENQTILVVGDDSHKVGYKEVIEKHGGNFNFINGITTKSGLVRKKALSSDITFLVTKYCQHDISDGIIDLPNLYFVNSAGIDSLEREILKLQQL